MIGAYILIVIVVAVVVVFALWLLDSLSALLAGLKHFVVLFDAQNEVNQSIVKALEKNRLTVDDLDEDVNTMSDLIEAVENGMEVIKREVNDDE